MIFDAIFGGFDGSSGGGGGGGSFPTGTPDKIAWFNSNGDIESNSSLGINALQFGGLDFYNSVTPDDTTDYKNLHNLSADFNPTVNNSQENWTLFFMEARVGSDDSGNQLGDGTDGSIRGFASSLVSRNKSNIGQAVNIGAYSDFGNGTDAITGRRYAAFSGSFQSHNNVEFEYVDGFTFSVGTGTTNSKILENITALNMFGSAHTVEGGVYGAIFSLGLQSINFYEGVMLAHNAVNISASARAFSDVSNITGRLTGYYQGISIFPQINELDGGFTGINIDPTITDSLNASYSTGIRVSVEHIEGTNKKAAEFIGDVSIDGNFSFTGSISIGILNAYGVHALSDGGGTPASAHSLISSLTAPANATIANADTIGVNTAGLIQIGDNANITTAFLGVSALGLPAVVELGTGASVDKINGAVFAISLSNTASGGSIDTVNLCSALALPNGVTAIDKLRGYAFDLPFGDPGTETWGLYLSPDCFNWVKGSLKIGGAAGSTDKASGTNKLQISGGDMYLESDVKVGFYGTSPVTQPTSSGPATAGGSYGSTEQGMLQEVYNAVRALGLMS